MVAVTMSPAPAGGQLPRQQVGTAVGRPHRVTAAVTLGRIVGGKVVPATSPRLAGPRPKISHKLVPGAVPPPTRPRPLRLPARGTPAAQRASVVGPQPPAAITGYDQATSRALPPSRADQVVYANADGTRTAFEYAQPVNYRRSDGSWTPISTTLVPAGPPSSTTGPASPSAPTPSTGAATPSAATPTAPTPSAGGWTEKSEAAPETFGPYANSPDLVSLPVGQGQVVGFGVAGAAGVPGAAHGSTVDYAGALPDSTVEFTAGTGMVKEQLVLASPDAPATWVFPLHLTGLHAQLGPGGIVQFADAAAKVVAYVPPGLMTDSNIDPHSGDGAMSAGVSYSLATVGGQPAITMTLDTAWLDSAARVYPVTVDPSVTSVNANGTTYVQYPETGDFSGDNEVHVGTWDGGSDIAESYLAFGNVASQLNNDTVLGVRLGVFNTWSYSCSPRAVYVYPVTSSWSVTGSKSWSTRPSTGASVGRASFATGWVPLGSTVSPCPASWKGINLDQAGTNLVNGWTHGTVADNGLAVGASNSDSYAWKKFASDASGTGDPFLAVTYTPDGASYKLASSRPVTPVTPSQAGKFAVRVTNTGSSTWTTTNGYEISYEAYNSRRQLVANHPVFTPMPSTVAPGQSVTVNVTVNALPVGSYAINFDMYSGATGSSPVSFKSQGIAPYAIGLFVPEPPPVVSAVYPPTGYISPTLRQQLSTSATATGTITYSFKLTCEPVTGQTCVATTISSGTISNPYWTPPAASLQWNTQYQWTVTVTGTSNGSSTSTTVGPVKIMAQVPQPGITSSLGGSSGQAYDPLSGNYTTSATDAAVASAGPPLRIVRTYNSLDPRTAGAFGAGWSSVLDTALRPDNDGSGSVVVTLPSGQQMRFGQNGNGNYAAPFGNSDALVHNSSGTWTLRDASGNEYTFTSAGLLSQIIDRSGLTQNFTDNSSGEVTTMTNQASGRTLTVTWSTPAGAAHAHVQSVTTQAPATGQSGYTWSYSYTADELTGACAPATTGTGCTAYNYASGSHYRAGVLDSGPRDYWQLGEASGTTAADEAEVNLGTTDGTYHNVTLGVAGPLGGSSETAAGFNGTSSSVSLPNNLITDSTDVTVELWFKAASSSASGVLFSYQTDALSNSGGNSAHHVPALYIGGNGELYGEFWQGSVAPIHTTTSVANGAWHYAVLTASSSSQSLYLDGTLVGTLSGQLNQLNMAIDTVGAGFWQAGWPSATQGGTATSIGYFNGDIAQVAVYPHPIGASAVATHYALGGGAAQELSQVTLPSGNVYEEATYDSATGRLASYTDPNGGQWTIGQPLATGQKTNSDALGEVLDNISITDPAGRQETYSYDMLDGGRLVAFDNSVDPMEVYGYDAAGFLTFVTDQDGNLVCFTNDAHGNVLTRTWYPIEPAGLPGVSTGIAAACGGSASSSPTCPSSGAPCTTFYSYAAYDTANPLDPKNTELTAVRDGRSASVSDSTYQTRYSYNAAGQLTSRITPNTSDFPAGRTTTYGYSTGSEAAYGGGTVPAGLLLAQATPGGAVTSYQYYSGGDLAKVTEPSGAYTVYTYDALGRPLTSTVTTSSFPSGETTSYTYDGLGHQLTVTYPAVTNQVVSPSVTHQLQNSYAYDADGNLLSLTQSDLTGGDAPRTTSYTYNDHGEMATATQPAGATAGGSAPPQGAASANPQGATTSYDYDGFGNVTQRTDPNGNVYRYSYNEYQEPTQVELYTASTSASAPTAGCTAPAVQDSDGGCDLVLDSYAYDPAGLLAATTDAMGRITNYTYDHDQDVIATTTTDPSTSPTTGRQTTYGYDGAGNLVSQSVSAMSGGSVGTTTLSNYTVDAADRLASQVQDATPAGGSGSYLNRTVSYTYNADNHVLSQTMGTAAEGGTSVTNYGYDTAGDRTSQTVVDGSTSLATTWTYNQVGQQLSMTTPAGNAAGATAANFTTNYAYGPAGNLVTVTGAPVATQSYSAQGLTTTRPVTTFGYDTFGDQTQVADPNGNIAVTGYDGDGRVTSVTRPSYTPPGASSAITATTSFGYDENGNLVQQTDPQGNVTQFGYDGLGDLTSETDPQLPGQSAPGVWNFTYDADSEQLSAADPLGNTTHATYDYFGQQVTSTDALGNTTKYAHDYLGDQTSITTPDGSAISQTFDRLGELTSSADAYGNTSKFTYDDLGRLANAYNPDGSFAQYGFDQAGNLTSLTDYGPAPAGQAAPQLRSASLGYDPNGNLTSAKDWNGNTTSYTYDAAGELTSQVRPVSSSSSISTAYGYDPAGNQTAVTGGNGNTTWTTYNPWGLPESVIEPATAAAPSAGQRTWTTAYNANGQTAAVTQPGGISLSYGYDPLGDVTSQTGSGASAPTTARSFGYDLDGRMTSASAPGGTDSFSYNADSALTGTSGPSGTSSFSYNGDGLLSAETSPAGTTGYTYDAADRLATESEPLTGATLTYAYNADSLPTSVSYASGGAAGPVQAVSYDSLRRVASDTVTSASGKTLAAQTYGYDANGNLTSQTTGGLMAAASTSFGYDEAGRLTSATTGGTSTSYAYDGDGNLIQSGATSYAVNAQDQVTSATAASGTTSYGYTLSGALASVTPPGGGAQQYTSDAFGQQTTAPGGVSYGYDALGRTATRTVGASTTPMAYLGTSGTLASDGSYDYTYDPSGGVTAAGTIGGSAFVTMNDQHGDLAATFSPTSSAAGLAGYATYGPYGTASASGNKPNLGFQGNYTDPATGQVDMGARWYNPATGGFTTNDTIGGSPLSSTVDGNPYAYTGGNPLTQTDPTGHCTNPMGICWPNTGTGVEDPPITEGGPSVGIDWGEFWSLAAATAALGAALAAGGLGPWDPWGGSGRQSSGSSQGTSPYNGYGSFTVPIAGLNFGGMYYPYGYPIQSPTSPGGNPGGGSYPGSQGGTCGFACYAYVPPPPPPPPQDCYAGPEATCTPPPAPSSLRDDPWITTIVHDITNISQLFHSGHGIIERPVPNKRIVIKGTAANTRLNGNPDVDTTQDPSNLTTDIHDQHPVDPSPTTPGSSTAVNLPGPSGLGGGFVAPTLPQPVSVIASNGTPQKSKTVDQAARAKVDRQLNLAGQAREEAPLFGGRGNGGNSLPPTLNGGCFEDNGKNLPRAWPFRPPWSPWNPLGEASNWQDFIDAVTSDVDAARAFMGHGATGTTATVGVNTGPAIGPQAGQGIATDPWVAGGLATIAFAAFLKKLRSQNGGSGGCD